MFEESIQGKSLQRLARVGCSLGFFIEGYQAGILGGVQDTKPFLDALGVWFPPVRMRLRYIQRANNQKNPGGTETIPLIASSYTLAAAVMSLVVVFVGMPLGRRNSILIGAIAIFFGGIIQAASYSIAQIVVARIICGIGIALITCNVPMYMSEMSLEAGERGPEVAINCSGLLAGVATSYWVDFGFTRMTNQVSWRVPLSLQSLVAIFCAICIFFCPDTPRWYYAKGRIEEGDQTLARLYNVYRGDIGGHETEVNGIEMVKGEIMRSIQAEAEQENRLDWMCLFWDNTPLRVGRRIRISFIILSIQQMMGINILVYYMTLIFSDVGLSSFISSLIAAVALTVQFFGSLLTIPTIERLGRRKIMLVAATAQSCCMLIFVVLNGLPSSLKSSSTQWAAAIIMFPYLFMYGWGWLTCPWLYGPEIAPLKYRHIGAAIGIFGEWLFSFITVFLGGIGITSVGWKIWIWPLVFNVVAVPFVYYMCPDPTGKTLEEIDSLFIKDESWANRVPHSLDEKATVNQVEEAA